MDGLSVGMGFIILSFIMLYLWAGCLIACMAHGFAVSVRKRVLFEIITWPYFLCIDLYYYVKYMLTRNKE